MLYGINGKITEVGNYFVKNQKNWRVWNSVPDKLEKKDIGVSQSEKLEHCTVQYHSQKKSSLYCTVSLSEKLEHCTVQYDSQQNSTLTVLYHSQRNSNAVVYNTIARKAQQCTVQ